MILTIHLHMPEGIILADDMFSADLQTSLRLLPARYPPLPYPALVRLRAINASALDANPEPIEITASIDFYGPATMPPDIDPSIPQRMTLTVIDGHAPGELVEAWVPATYFETLTVWQPAAAAGITPVEWQRRLAMPEDGAPATALVADWRTGRISVPAHVET
jgi:hypothetical protein